MEMIVFIMSIFIWVVVGLWINHKRNWYKQLIDKDTREASYFFNVLLAPFALFLAFIRIFILNPWNND